MSKQAEARALTAAQPTATLVTSLRAIVDPKTPEERMVHAWIIDALEERYPAAGAAVEKAFDEAEQKAIMSGELAHPAEDVDYVAVLLAAIPEVTA
jgi:hypothetical protein